MTARIYKPSKTAMQSGLANTKAWAVDFEPEEPRTVEPLMGWTSSGDMRQQLRLRFASKEEAIAYCERHGIAYQVSETPPPARRGHVLFGQFLLQAPRRLDPLTSIVECLSAARTVEPQRIGLTRRRLFASSRA